MAEANLPSGDPRTLDCYVCDTLIGDDDWDWAAMPQNGPVHARCFMTGDELLAENADPQPCCGCDTSCDQYDTCINSEVIMYGDGVNNCVIVRPGADLDDVADHYRNQGYRVVH